MATIEASLTAGIKNSVGGNTSAAINSVASLDTLLNNELSQETQALITPQMRKALNKGLTVANDLAPAYSVVNTIASGGVPDEQQVVLGMAGLATAVNPLAGAAIMAAGELVIGIEAGLKGLFDALGLTGRTNVAVPYVGLIKVGDPVPVPPKNGIYDQYWKRWADFAWWEFPKEGGATRYGFANPGLANYHSQDYLTTSFLIPELIASIGGHYIPPNYHTQGVRNIIQPKPNNDFEKFFFPILQRNIEYWANANAYIDFRALFLAAIHAWNDKHVPSDKDFTYLADEKGDGLGPALLSSHGDVLGKSRHSSEIVNMGTILDNPPPNTITVHKDNGETLRIAAVAAGAAIGTAAGQATIAQLQRQRELSNAANTGTKAAYDLIARLAATHQVKITKAKPLTTKKKFPLSIVLAIGGTLAAIILTQRKS